MCCHRSLGILHRLGLSLLLVFPLVLTTQSAAFADQFERRVRAVPGGAVRVALDRGTLEVVPLPQLDRGEVRIEANSSGFGASDVDFRLVRRGPDWVLRVEEASWLRFVAAGPRVSVKAFVPPDVPVELARPSR